MTEVVKGITTNIVVGRSIMGVLYLANSPKNTHIPYGLLDKVVTT